MKKYIVLFAILITAVFLYPVFAHAQKIGLYLVSNPLSEPAVMFILGSSLLVFASLTRRLVNIKK